MTAGRANLIDIEDTGCIRFNVPNSSLSRKAQAGVSAVNADASCAAQATARRVDQTVFQT